MASNPVLDGLQLFNQGVSQLAQQRALTEAADAVQQIKSSEMSQTQQRQALQAYGQQFALRAQAAGMDPNTAIATGKEIGPPQPLIQSGLEAAVYGTPEDKQNFQDYQKQQFEQAIKLKQAEDTRYQMQADQAFKRALAVAKINANSREQISSDKLEKQVASQQQKQIDYRGKQFLTDPLLKEHANLKTQYGAIKQLINSPNQLSMGTAYDAFHQLVEKSTSKEADIRRVEGAGGLVSKIETTINGWEGKDTVAPPEVIKRLDNAAQALSSKLDKAASFRHAQHVDKLKQVGGDPSLYDPLLFLNPSTSQSAQPAMQQPQQPQQPQGVQSLFKPGPIPGAVTY